MSYTTFNSLFRRVINSRTIRSISKTREKSVSERQTNTHQRLLDVFWLRWSKHRTWCFAPQINFHLPHKFEQKKQQTLATLRSRAVSWERSAAQPAYKICPLI